MQAMIVFPLLKVTIFFQQAVTDICPGEYFPITYKVTPVNFIFAFCWEDMILLIIFIYLHLLTSKYSLTNPNIYETITFYYFGFCITGPGFR